MKHVHLFSLLAIVGLFCHCAPKQEQATTETPAAPVAPSPEEREKIDPKLTEFWEPVPPVITPGEGTLPPSDAIVLFDGKNLEAWKGEREETPTWTIADNAMTVTPKTGGIVSKQGFGDIQLHVEWRAPSVVKGESQGRGNSGIFLMGKYEVQVLDNYENATYVNGQAGSIYKQHVPLVNACRPPGVWQTYDIIFTAPRFQANGSVETPAYITVIHNGVLVQNHVELRGPTQYKGPALYEAHPDKLPISLQEHSNPVSYRNIWVRELTKGISLP